MKIQRVGIVGCGIMGSGIAQLCAQKGCDVFVTEKNSAVLEKGLAAIRAGLKKIVDSGRLVDPDVSDIMGRIHGASEFNHLAGCDFVIEAVTEDLSLKKEIFGKLDKLCGEEAILATNTSVLSIVEVAKATSRAENVIGTHFLTPPPVIELLEVIPTLLTSRSTLETTKQFGTFLGKKVVVSADRPGFIVNRILTSIMFNAVRLLEEGVATQEDIDTAVTAGLGLPMGAFELLDLIGMDTVLLGSTEMFKELNDSQYFCPVSIRRMVSAGLLGRKTGRGFYRYKDEHE
jgi:3-hydroxybutyryl-CoA dehydrogenase